jgi:hypothetical protein
MDTRGCSRREERLYHPSRIMSNGLPWPLVPVGERRDKKTTPGCGGVWLALFGFALLCEGETATACFTRLVACDSTQCIRCDRLGIIHDSLGLSNDGQVEPACLSEKLAQLVNTIGNI